MVFFEHSCGCPGQVAKSIDLNGAATLLVLLVLLSVFWRKHLFDIQQTMRALLNSAHQLNWSIDTINALFQRILSHCLALFVPFALALILVVCVATIMQTGIVFSTKPLVPDFKRINPVSGLKKFFSVKLLFDSAKNSAKLAACIGLVATLMYHHLQDFLSLTQASVHQYPRILMSLWFDIAFKLFLLLCVFALIDGLFSRWKYGKDNRMSKQEVKDEHKQREGDPKVKAKIKQLQREMRARSASVKDVKEANVVITNPTHLAIALQYNRHDMPAPKVTCKASGDLAKLVRKEAHKHQIPIIENKPFARALFQSVQLNQYIDEQFFPVAAAIFKQIYTAKGGDQ